MDFLSADYIELDRKLRNNGLCIVPIKATNAMQEAAAQAMRLRKEAMGDEWVMVGNKTKAGLRWRAMLDAWWASGPKHP